MKSTVALGVLTAVITKSTVALRVLTAVTMRMQSSDLQQHAVLKNATFQKNLNYVLALLTLPHTWFGLPFSSEERSRTSLRNNDILPVDYRTSYSRKQHSPMTGMRARNGERRR
jgi:hypothetical protein